jgi:hypothetical protein
MKKLAIALFVSAFVASGCEDSEELGCLSGIIQGTNNRIFLECITRSQYASGYGAPGTIPYDNIIWTPIDQCDQCLTLDYSQF